MTLVFTKGQDKNNSRKFTCIAKNGVTVAKLEYDNYIGGERSAIQTCILWDLYSACVHVYCVICIVHVYMYIV